MIRVIAFISTYLLGIALTWAQVKSEDIVIKNDSIELPGTLTYSEGDSQLIIWVHGSGNVDRNGNQGKSVRASYIQQFRKAINVNNIAFFSYDKRTSNPKNFKFLMGTSFGDLVEDARKVVNHFKKDKRFSEIIIAGHSQGSLIGMLISKGADKYISIAGPSTSIDKTISEQIGVNAPMLKPITIAHFKELKETGNVKEVNPYLTSIFAKQNFAFLRDWMQFDPIQEIQKLKIPTLIINGNKDLQVKVEDAKALHKAKPTSTLAIIDKMNHILIELEKDSDNLKSYATPGFLMSDELIVSILNFIKK